MDIETIHDSLINGQRRQMVNQIDEYGNYDFWNDYKGFLIELCCDKDEAWWYFTDACISYNRIKNR